VYSHWCYRSVFSQRTGIIAHCPTARSIIALFATEKNTSVFTEFIAPLATDSKFVLCAVAFCSKKGRRQSCVRYWQERSQLSTAVQDDTESLKGSHKMGDGQISTKFSAPLSLINTYQMNVISAGSFSLDSTFNVF